MTTNNAASGVGQYTDYATISLDEMWQAVSQPDNRTWPQLSTWYTMATICGDQAAQLRRALDQLMARWLPTPNSAAQSFATMVNSVIASMERDAADAERMQPVLLNVASELAATKSQLQPIMEAQKKYLAVEQARVHLATGYTTMPADSPDRALANEDLPSNWRDDLHAQAVSVMHTSDANLGSLTNQMPTLTWLPPPNGQEHFTPVRGTRDGNSVAGGATTLGSGALLGASPSHLEPNSRTIGLPAQPNTPDGSRLTGLLTPGSAESGLQPIDPEARVGSGTPSTSRPPSIRLIGPIRGVIGEPIHAAGGSSGSGTRLPGRPAGMGSSSPADQTRPATGSSPLVATPGMGRAGQPAPRQSVRRSGRAALWASQRRKNPHDSADPWHVPKGIPAVIDAPDHADHQPGPGVIGIDR